MLFSAPAFAVEVENFCNSIKKDDGSVVKQCPNSGEYWDDVFDRAFRSIEPSSSRRDLYRVGEIKLGNNVYRLQELILYRGHYIIGCGTSCSILEIDRGITTRVCAGGKETDPACASPMPRGFKGDATLEKLSVWGTSKSQGATGITASARIALRDVEIRWYSMGLRIEATYPQGNANGVYLSSVQIRNMASWGLYVRGADANAGHFEHVDISNVCEKAVTDCWGWKEQSFLGNTIISPQVAYVWNTKTKKEFPSYIISVGNNNAPSAIINPYQEGSAVGSFLGGNITVIGGNIQNAGDDSVVQLRGHHLKGSIRYADGTGLLGLHRDTPFAFSSGRQLVDMGWKPEFGVFGWRVGQLSGSDLSMTTHRSQTSHGTKLTPNRAWVGMQGCIYESKPNATIEKCWGKIRVGKSCASSLVGSRIVNNAPLKGEPLEAVCVCQGTIINRGKCVGGPQVWVAK